MQIKEELLDIEGIKNSNKSLIDLFIRRTAVITSTPEHITELIVKDQWKRANQILSGKSKVAEVDFPNLGSFRLSQRKGKNRLDKLKEYQLHCSSLVLEDPKSKKVVEERMKLNDTIMNDITLKMKTNEN